MKDIREIAAILDEHIAKGVALDLKKGLTFDPYRPHEMGSDSPYYSPYMQLGDGSFAPYPVETLAAGKEVEPTDYLTVRQFYSSAGEAFRPGPAYYKFQAFKKAIPATIKPAGKASPGPAANDRGVPVGTIHTYKDGQKYKKMAPGVWVPVKLGPQHGLMHPDQKKRQKAHADIETHAHGVGKIQEELKKRQDHKKIANEARKQVLRHVRQHIGRVFDGDVPQEAKKDFDLRRNPPGMEPEKGPAQQFREKIKRGGEGEGRPVDLKVNEVKALLKSGKYALISAGVNPNVPEDRNLPDKVVAKRYEALRGELKKAGYAFTQVKGNYGGEEDSFLVMVHEADKPHITALGKKFNQDSVIYSEGGKHQMIYTTGPKAGQVVKGEGHVLDEKKDDYYTSIKAADNGELKFSLNFDFPKEKEKFASTAAAFKDEKGYYKPEREKLHKQILGSFLDHVKPASGRPVAVLTGGGSGSGKSTVMKKAFQGLKQDQFVHVDADQIKANIPEYTQMVKAGDEGAAAFVHDESSDLSGELIRRSVEQGKNFVYDSTMKNREKFKRLISDLEKQGYMVHIIYADLPEEEAIKRAQERAKETGRKVPEDAIRSSHEGSRKTLGELADLAHSVSVFSTKADPKVVYHRQGSKKDVDKNYFNDMKKRGHTIKSEKKDGKKPMEDEEKNEFLESLLEQVKKVSGVDYSKDRDSKIEDEGVSLDQYPRRNKGEQ